MFILNFYSNSDFYINIWLITLVLSLILWYVYLVTESRRSYYLFLLTAGTSILINLGTYPLMQVLEVYLWLILLLPFFWGNVRYRILNNTIASAIFLILVGTGGWAIYKYVNREDFSEQTFFRHKAENLDQMVNNLKNDIEGEPLRSDPTSSGDQGTAESP